MEARWEFAGSGKCSRCGWSGLLWSSSGHTMCSDCRKRLHADAKEVGRGSVLEQGRED